MRLRPLSLAAALLVAVPGISFGLGLGEIQLKSTLNAPLNAEIELTATDEELATLKAQLASRDTFTRYGLDYPAFLLGVQVQLVRQSGRNVIQLTSSASITEPFATFLIEANWARGRIQREYTVLFDPPTFAPQAAPAAPVAAPAAGNPRTGEITRPAAPGPAPRPAAQPAPGAPLASAPGGGDDYTVRRGDSLSSLAQRQYGEGATRQAMIAIYRANPHAFGGNINQLRAGAVLRLPDSATVASIDRSEAAGEVRRQMAEWSGRAVAGPQESGTSPRLVLVPPGGQAPGTGSSTTPAPGPATPQPGPGSPADNRVSVGDAGLARVQENASRTEPKPAPAENPPAPVTPAPGETAAPTVVQTDPATTAPVPPQEKPKPAPAVAAPADTGPSWLDRLKQYWYAPVGVVALLALLLVRAARRRGAAAAADKFAPFAVEPTLADARDTSADTFPLRKPTEGRDTSIVVEESAVPRTVANRKEAPRTVDLDETPAGAPGIDATGSFEQGDPLAEADFHMAYGLYDQAADLVKLAIAREPARRDLKLKLLEVYFVWGNKEQFLVMARELAASRDAAQPGEWEKVVIMGKQLAPEDPLFTQSYGGVSPSTVDLNLEGGQNLVDFDLPSDSSTRLPQLGDAASADGGLSGLDFVLDDPGRGAEGDSATTQATQQLPASVFAIDGPTIEQPFAIDGPTVEQPALGIDDTLAGKIGAPRAPLGGTDQTAELALDDLGLDLGKLEATGSNLLDDSQLMPSLGTGDTGSVEQASETLVAGLDDTARQLLQQAGATQATELLPLTDLGSGDTSRVVSLDLNLDADPTAATGKRGTPDFSLDLDVGSTEQSADGEYQRTQRIDQPTVVDSDSTQRDLEPVSMSEVGTKLDLARAYMDMGDPDGARSILGEVLAEGSPTQRQEAQRLLDSIPG
jgi:pilus assembly protein FimV